VLVRALLRTTFRAPVLGDVADPLALPYEPPEAKDILDQYLADEIDAFDLDQRLDQVLGIGQTLDEMLAYRDAEDRRVAAEQRARKERRAMVEADIDRWNEARSS